MTDLASSRTVATSSGLGFASRPCRNPRPHPAEEDVGEGTVHRFTHYHRQYETGGAIERSRDYQDLVVEDETERGR